jgi:hypothetical protein
VQAAANVRITQKTKLLSQEYIKQQASQWLELYRQKITEAPIEVTVEGPNGYEFITVSAQELDKVQAILPEDDSTAPENSPQKRNDALALYNQTRGNDVVDPRWAVKHLLRSFDVADVEEAVLPEQVQMNPQVAQLVGESIHQTLLKAGADPKMAETLALQAVQNAMQAAGVSEPPAAAEQSQNGNAPAPQEAPVG